MGEWDDAILVGVVARAHGNRGEVIVNSETYFPEERFRQGARLLTRQRDGSAGVLDIATMRMHQGRPVIGFAGSSSISDAELLAGLELRVSADEPSPVLVGEYFHRDLIGCAVVTDTGEAVGRVTGVEGERGVSRLVIAGGRAEVLIPLAHEICTVDIAAKRITVRPPEGLLDVNGDWR